MTELDILAQWYYVYPHPFAANTTDTEWIFMSIINQTTT
jgi:hypothetical protein